MIKNCYEATIKMIELSEELTKVFVEKENTKEEKLDGRINSIECEFLKIKHSLEEIKDSYKLALNFISLNNEMMNLLDKKNSETDFRILEALNTRITSVEEEFLDVKHKLMKIQYVPTNRTDIFHI